MAEWKLPQRPQIKNPQKVMHKLATKAWPALQQGKQTFDYLIVKAVFPYKMPYDKIIFGLAKGSDPGDPDALATYKITDYGPCIVFFMKSILNRYPGNH